MKKTTLFLCLCMAAGTVSGQTDAKFLQGENMTNISNVSPNGKWAVGTSLVPMEWGLDAVYGFKSYKWDIEAETIEWVTDLTEDYSKSGSFADINDEGVICGTFKDPDNMLTISEWGSTSTLPLNVAAVWNGATVTSLGIGDYNTTDFTNFNDGSFATAISNDSKTVVGYLSFGNSAQIVPCAWVKNDATGEYEYKKYAMPENAQSGRIEDVSADGSIAVGSVQMTIVGYGLKTYACYWTSPENCELIEDPDTKDENGNAYAVSQNGEYIAVTFDFREPSLYLTKEKTFVKCGRYENVSGLEIGGVSDNGDMFGVYEYGSYMGGDMSNRPFWYSYSNKMMMDFSYYLKLWAEGVDIPYDFNYESKESLSLVSVSADAKVIVGGSTYQPFVIKTNAVNMTLPPVISEMKAKVTDLGQITVTIEMPEANDRFSAKEVWIYRDGTLLATVPVSGTEPITYVDKNVPTGERYYSASVVYEDKESGKTIESPNSEVVRVQMEGTFAFPFYDNFDSGSLSTNYWAVVKDYGETDYQSIGCPIYSGLKSSCSMFSSVLQYQPYSYSAVSRYIDARDKESVYASFVRVWNYVNSNEWPLDKDTLSFEVSTDGENWELAKDLRLCDVSPDKWSFEYVDLTPWAAGKMFKVRFRFHGQAAAAYLYKIDEFSIDEKPARQAPDNVLGDTDSEGNFSIAWKNSLDAYQLTYLTDPYYNTYGLAIGDEGNTFIAANMFTKEDLAKFSGKYLTSVTTMVNHDEYLENTTDTHASIVVFEDGKLIREQEFSVVYNTDQIVKLNEPVLIDGTKELKIGIKIYDYDARQLPIPYYNTYDFVAGKSDLYSQDGGATWQKLSDFFAQVEGQELDGYACWQITGNVTDKADADVPTYLDLDRFAAEVYKNGEKLTDKFVYLVEPGYTDKTSVPGDSYQVRVFYTDGTCTELSEPVVNKGTSSVEAAVAADGKFTYKVEDDMVNVNGDVKSVQVYDASGVKVYDGTSTSFGIANLSRGVYMLKVNGTNGNTETYKFVRR